MPNACANPNRTAPRTRSISLAAPTISRMCSETSARCFAQASSTACARLRGSSSKRLIDACVNDRMYCTFEEMMESEQWKGEEGKGDDANSYLVIGRQLSEYPLDGTHSVLPLTRCHSCTPTSREMEEKGGRVHARHNRAPSRDHDDDVERDRLAAQGWQCLQGASGLSWSELVDAHAKEKEQLQQAQKVCVQPFTPSLNLSCSVEHCVLPALINAFFIPSLRSCVTSGRPRSAGFKSRSSTRRCRFNRHHCSSTATQQVRVGLVWFSFENMLLFVYVRTRLFVRRAQAWTRRPGARRCCLCARAPARS